MKAITDLVEQMREVPADGIVDTLRKIHLDSLPDRPRREEHRQRGSESRSAGVDTDAWERARSYFVDVEEKMQERRSTADSVIDRLRDRDTWQRARRNDQPSQQLLAVTVVVGETGGGRFVVTNPHSGAAEIDLVVGPFTLPGGRKMHVPVSLDPPRLTLASRGKRVVACRVDLGGDLGITADTKAEFSITGYVRNRKVMQVWVELDLVLAEDGLMEDNASARSTNV